MKTNSAFVPCVLALLAPCALACGEPAESGEPRSETRLHADPAATLHERLVEIDEDLRLGSQGDHVHAVYDYLMAYGYFPSRGIQADYPGWLPAVDELPDDAALYDDRMARAVTKLQANLGLPQTGVVDVETREALQRPRCGVPDNIEGFDPRDKFAHYELLWGSKSNFTYRVQGGGGGVTKAQTESAMFAAFDEWRTETSITFAQLSSGAADIDVRWDTLPGGFGAISEGPFGDIIINETLSWSVATPTPAGKIDLVTVLLHELGHSLGLNHSSLSGSTMFPTYTAQDRQVALDDAVGISALFDTWQVLPGSATDIGVGANDTAWIIGTSPVSGGFNIMKWNGSGWSGTSGGAVRIAVEPNGIPWALNSVGQIFRRTSSSTSTGTWEVKSGCATDIGVGANGAVWAVGCTPVSGGFNIMKWNGTGWSTADGGATRIAVGPTGVPWAQNSLGQIYRRLSSAAGTVGWEQIPGCGNDIGIAQGNYAWQISCFAVNGGFKIQVWNEQTLLEGPPESEAPARATWIPVAGGAVAVSVGANGRPWVINSIGQIFRATK